MPNSSPLNPAEQQIRRRIREHGKITFAEFMETALYHPKGGYYNRGRNIGAAGDFFTSPKAHP
ncbi:MAG: SAM-dependent methyltransferase, partial [Chloroflexi bacterium]|nr:SAM-dependent methyltransferase [Chloroflexota bacterium]